MKVKILFEDKNVLVINKPAGVAVHADGKTKVKTISDWIILNYPSIKNVGEPFIIEREGGKKEKILRPGIVHRLDRETSGVLIIAKNQKTFQFLKDQFQSHKVKKFIRPLFMGLFLTQKHLFLLGEEVLLMYPLAVRKKISELTLQVAEPGSHSKKQ